MTPSLPFQKDSFFFFYKRKAILFLARLDFNDTAEDLCNKEEKKGVDSKGMPKKTASCKKKK